MIYILNYTCYTDAKEREKLRYLLMMDKTPEELANFFPDDEIIKMFRGEIVRLNSNAKFIREISEEEEKEMIHNTELKLSKQEGKEEGHVEGKAEGIEEPVFHRDVLDDPSGITEWEWKTLPGETPPVFCL